MIEICCGSYEDALNAYYGGAKRIELNSALHLGGLTPSIGSLKLTKNTTNLKVICMVRPRGAGFCYTDIEFKQMMIEAKDLLENDIERTKEMVSLIKSYQKEAVFHRAYDCVKDPYASIEILINLGIDRLLTSGLRAKAADGKDLIKKLQTKYGDKIEILAGSGINSTNGQAIMEYTGIDQIHSSCKDWQNDPTTSGEFVNYCYGPAEHKDDFDMVSKELVEKLVKLGL